MELYRPIEKDNGTMSKDFAYDSVYDIDAV